MKYLSLEDADSVTSLVRATAERNEVYGIARFKRAPGASFEFQTGAMIQVNASPTTYRMCWTRNSLYNSLLQLSDDGTARFVVRSGDERSLRTLTLDEYRAQYGTLDALSFALLTAEGDLVKWRDG